MAKVSEWQGGGGSWYAADVSDLKNQSSLWWKIPRLLNLSLTEYIRILIENYGVNYIKLSDNGFLCFSWNNYNKCHKFVLDMNKKLKQAGKFG